MPIPTAFHSRTAALCQTQEWRDWSGYLSAITYQPSHETEYYAVRNAAGLIDVSPLYKYEISGPDASRLVDRIITRDAGRCAVGQVLYTPWCDEDGKVIDDGTVIRLEAQRFRVTAADPSLRWFQDCGYGMDAEVRDVSRELAALAIQGPNSRAVLQAILNGIDLDTLPYYHAAAAQLDNTPLTVTRTGYTGDLGYELWIAAEEAETLWDRLMAAGSGYGLQPVGLAALDMLRVEAGLLLIDVDYTSSRSAHIASQTASPYELGLGWAVDLKGADFMGKRALLAEQRRGTQRQFVGLRVPWADLERLYGAVDLPPQVAGRASRSPLPLYASGRHVGQATSLVFSPILKEYIALGTVERRFARRGKRLGIEITVEYERQRATATMSKLPFYAPPWKKTVIDG
jgi:aminomethyltransferase